VRPATGAQARAPSGTAAPPWCAVRAADCHTASHGLSCMQEAAAHQRLADGGAPAAAVAAHAALRATRANAALPRCGRCEACATAAGAASRRCLAVRAAAAAAAGHAGAQVRPQAAHRHIHMCCLPPACMPSARARRYRDAPRGPQGHTTRCAFCSLAARLFTLELLAWRTHTPARWRGACRRGPCALVLHSAERGPCRAGGSARRASAGRARRRVLAARRGLVHVRSPHPRRMSAACTTCAGCAELHPAPPF